IADELRSHLEERLDELQADGHDRDEAIRLALDEFGDANALAADFTHTLRHARRTRTRRRLMQTTAGTLMAAAVVTFAVMTLTPNNFQGTPNQSSAIADAPTTAPAIATVDGRVGKPGPIDVPKDGMSLNKFLAMAGGVEQNPGDRISVSIDWHDPGVEDLTVKLEEAFANGDQLRVRPGDHVVVEAQDGPIPKPGFVYAMGDFNRPGTYTVPGPDRLSLKQFIASAGGIQSNRAPESQRITIIRRTEDGGEEVTITTWSEVQQRTKPFFLRPDDLVKVDVHPDFAPAFTNRFAVLDIAPLIRDVVELEFEEGGEVDDGEVEAELVESVVYVLEGLGHADDFTVVRSWMGTLTIVGNEVAVEAARAYLREIEGMIELRTARQTSGRSNPDQSQANASPIMAEEITLRPAEASN
ncbi:MAG: permease prefix domain 1-containing protein, partial [Planctomycetota bacterium]